MSLPVFRHPDLRGAQPGQPVGIDGAEGRHAVTVKRIAPGEQVQFADSAGRTATVSVTEVRGKDVLVGTVEEVAHEELPRPQVVVVQAIPKSERAELAVDLATQAGADEIIAWQAQRCVAKWDAKKAPKALAKWQAAAQAAAKQARRARVPEVSGPLTTAQLAQELQCRCDEGAVVYVLHEEATQGIKDVDLDADVVVLVVGPEGGIGSDELAALPGQAVKLGPQVVRTAAAAMVALAAIGVRTTRW
ncbi:16S rRNA (uracil(1498)-N(3))-methyltransferase [Corynebacterium lizhenjunii]|uniref:Ribosomal RNA small subunit methyltransferase E n=1 Tax=Corynebacterium lizhenjunii TaxID=2709394 RepID=A0A7T0PAQ9_9CORY|nr:16S rRNA (uracil(1498)-N(3))-methyltransferase [Corynebacterium lizhenjunii]QPK78615.1 16S rRNA (uracil(1498)-N(3))-methyltransferase [Corynebacterium lizhenjunii]